VHGPANPQRTSSGKEGKGKRKKQRVALEDMERCDIVQRAESPAISAAISAAPGYEGNTAFTALSSIFPVFDKKEPAVLTFLSSATSRFCALRPAT
jgi:hypothetical protein